jgi:hypothetical protein
MPKALASFVVLIILPGCSDIGALFKGSVEPPRTLWEKNSGFTYVPIVSGWWRPHRQWVGTQG